MFVLWMLSFDRLLRKVYADDRDLWVSLGKPPGWFWSPPGVSWLRGAAVRQHVVTDTWIYKPAWVDRSPEWRKLWWRTFILSILAFVMPILLMIYAFTNDV